MNPHDEAAALWQACGAKMQVLPGNQLPPPKAGADVWHICSTQPVPNASNFQGVCARCGAQVFWSDDRPALKKICPACVVQKSQTQPIEAYANEQTLLRVQTWLNRQN
jgi:hypothetical protein